MASLASSTHVRVKCGSFTPFRSPGSHQNRNIRISTCATRNGHVSPAARAGLAALLLGGRPAWAEEIADGLSEAAEGVQQTSISDFPSPEEVAEKVPAAAGSVFDLFADNPIIIAGLAFLALVPVALSFLGGGTLGVKSLTAASAVAGLGEDPTTLLIDIRSREEIKEEGSPNLSSVKKRLTSLPFKKTVGGEVIEDEDWVEKFNSLKSVKPESTIILLDSYGREAPKAAKALAKLAGRVYYVQGGAEGPRGWKDSGQPWKEPGKSLLNFEGLADDFKSQPTWGKAGIAAGAVGIASLVLFQEAGTVLELAAATAAGAFVLPRFLTPGGGADTEGGTQKQVRTFVEEGSAVAQKAAKEVKKAADSDAGQSVKNAAKETASKVEDGAKDLASKTEATAKEAVGEAKPAAKEAAGKAENAVKDGAEAADGAMAEGKEGLEQNAKEAREWIENWREKSKSA